MSQLKSAAEIKKIQEESREIVAAKVRDYADQLSNEFMNEILAYAMNPDSKDDGAKSSVSFSVDCNSKLQTIDTMRKNREIKYLRSMVEKTTTAFANIGYEIETMGSRSGSYHHLKISW